MRGCDAAHVASALTWQDAVGQETVLATVDRRLWKAALSADGASVRYGHRTRAAP